MSGVVRILSNPHAWGVFILFLVCVFLHYPQQIPLVPDVAGLLGLERHSLERILFLAPVILVGIVFGLKGGGVCLVMALVAMLPRVFFISPHIRDALFETGAVVVVGGLINWWLESRRREMGQREQALLRLEAMRHELNTYIQVIKRNEKRLSVMHSVTAIINQLVTLDDILSGVADKIKEAVEVDVVLIFLLNDRTGELDLKVHRGVRKGFARHVDHIKVGEGFNGWVAQTGEPCLVEDSSLDPRFSIEAVRQENIKSQYLVPLVSKGKIVGTFCCATHTVRHFAKEERELLMLIGDELGVAVEKTSLYEESARVGKKFRELFERAHDGIWMHDMNGIIIAANQGTSDLVGYEIDELIGADVSKFLAPLGLELARGVRRGLLRGDEVKQPYEQRVVREDGTEAILMLTTSVVSDESGLVAFQNIARDVTRERQLQENLRLYVRQITCAHEDERRRIARELHDDSIQAMIVLSRRIDDLACSDMQPQDMVGRLEEIRKEIDGILARVRRFIQDLRSPTLEYLGLIPALRELVSHLKQQAKIESELTVVGTEMHFTPEDELLIYRIVQESLSNVRKHAKASNVIIVVEFCGDRTRISIGDDGAGFEVKRSSGFVHRGRIGLAGMQERAQLLGASLTIHSKLGKGTMVVLDIPVERHARVEEELDLTEEGILPTIVF